jgi:hypothetical protein
VFLGRNLGIVRAVAHIGLHDPAVHRAVPAVVAERAEEGLVDRAAGELAGPGVVSSIYMSGVQEPGIDRTYIARAAVIFAAADLSWWTAGNRNSP